MAWKIGVGFGNTLDDFKSYHDYYLAIMDVNGDIEEKSLKNLNYSASTNSRPYNFKYKWDNLIFDIGENVTVTKAELRFKKGDGPKKVLGRSTFSENFPFGGVFEGKNIEIVWEEK